MAVCTSGALFNVTSQQNLYDNGYFPCWENGLECWIKDSDFDCDRHYANCDCPRLNGDSDVAGVGVIAAFFTTAALTIIATAICLLLSRASSNKTSSGTNNVRPPLQTINPIDRICRLYFSDKIKMCTKSADLWAECSFDLVISLSDQQLVTGFAVMVAGLIGLNKGTMTIYHFSTVANLAWFSSNTHLLSLLVVRSYEDSVKPGSAARNSPRQKHYSRQAIKWIRLSLMVGMACLLLYSSWVSAYARWGDEFMCPAKCALRGKRGGSGVMWMGLNWFYVFFNYPLQIVMLTRGFRIWWIDGPRPRLLDHRGQPGSCETTSIWERCNYLHICGKPLRVVWYILSSELEALVEMTWWFTWGAYQLIRDRKYGHSIMKDPSIEDTTGFGQLLPLFLLALPILQIAESHARHSYPAKEMDRRRPLSSRKRADISPRLGIALAPVRRATIPARIRPANSSV